MADRSAGRLLCANRMPPSRINPGLSYATQLSYRSLGAALPCWRCRIGGGSIVLLPTDLLASPSASWGMAVGPSLAYEKSAETGGFGLGVGEGVVGGQGLS